MKTIFTFLAACLLFLPALFAQTIAGTVPAGMSLIYPNINLTNSVAFSEVTVRFNIDCDTAADMRISLDKASPAIDAPNSIKLHILDTTYEVCKGIDSADTFG